MVLSRKARVERRKLRIFRLNNNHTNCSICFKDLKDSKHHFFCNDCWKMKEAAKHQQNRKRITQKTEDLDINLDKKHQQKREEE